MNEVSGSTATATVDPSSINKTVTARSHIVWMLVKEGGEWKLDHQLSGQRIGSRLVAREFLFSSTSPFRITARNTTLGVVPTVFHPDEGGRSGTASSWASRLGCSASGWSWVALG